MESTAPDHSSVDLSYYTAMLRRRWRLVVLGLVIGVLASVAFLFTQPHRATSTAQVNVNPIADNAFSSSRPASDLLVPETEQAMARSTDVVASVAALSEGDVTPAQVRANTVATLLPESTVLRIDYSAPTAEKAAAGATLVAQEYLTFRSSVAQERIELAVEQLEKRRKKLNTDLQQANQDAANSQGAAKAAAESRAQSVQSDLTSVNSQVNQLRAISTSGGTIISHPDPDRASLSPNGALIIVSGVFAGILLALVLPFLANALDRRVRDSHDVARAGGGSVVATLNRPEALVPPGEEDADQIRALRERLMAVVTTVSPVVVVADVGPSGSLPGDVAANLAVLVADAGRDTTLLLANYPKEAFAHVVTDLGLVEGRFVHGARYFHSRVVPSLLVVVPAPFVDRVSVADVVAGLLQEQRRRGSVTIVGVAPGDGQSVRLTAARLADQVVLNVPRVVTRKVVLSHVVADLRAVGAEIHGTVLGSGGRVLTGDASTVPPHPLEGRVPDRLHHDGDGEVLSGASALPVEAEEAADLGADRVEGAPEGEGASAQTSMFSPWFHRDALPGNSPVEQNAPEPNVPEATIRVDGSQRAAEIPADVPAEIPADVPAEIPADVPAETGSSDENVAPEVGGEKRSELSGEGSDTDTPPADDPRVIPVER